MHRLIALTVTLIALSGCKLAVIVVEGGEVQSTTSGTCQVAVPGITGSACIHEVTDTNYTETFTAVPEAGWEFVKWNSGGDFFCADSTNPVCVLSNVGTAGNAGIEAIIASDKAYYIMPIFQQRTFSTINADGKEWAQTDVFWGLNWNEVDAVCPESTGGVCNGVLNGYEVTGWIWASNSDVEALYSSYGISPPMSPANQQVNEFGSLWAPAFFAAGWVSYNDGSPEMFEWSGSQGWVRDSVDSSDANWADIVDFIDESIGLPDSARSGRVLAKTYAAGRLGAWIYRPIP